MTSKTAGTVTTKQAAQVKMNQFIDALQEHASEAERNDNPLMEDLYRTVLEGIYQAEAKSLPAIQDGKLTITLNLVAR